MFAIVAIPRRDDYVWNISSEKVPHMTLLAFEDPGWTPEQLAKVTGYIEHAASFLRRFGMDVDRRGELGEKKADVVFFNKNRWNLGDVIEFRSNLLANPDINIAVHEDENQFENWVPHLTLGFPAAPAKKDPRDYPGTSWVNFDRVALWTSQYDGPTFELKSDDTLMEDVGMSQADHASDVLRHYGVKGMKWGVRKKRQTSPDSIDTSRTSALKTTVRTQKTTRHLSNAELEDAIKRMRLEQEFSKLSGGLDKTRAQKARAFLAKLLADTGKETVTQATKTEARNRVDEAFKKARTT
jgi:hypothetical protein